MFIVTNRKISKKEGGVEIFKKTPNPKGSGEIRVVESIGDNQYVVLDNKLKKAKVLEIKETYNLDIDENTTYYSSLEVASRLFDQARKEQKQILTFVHGYNNDMEDIITTAKELEILYNVVVIVFSWPANGGGVVTGTMSYLSDKRVARNSTDALNLFFEKLHYYHGLFTNAEVKKLWIQASTKHKNNSQLAKIEYVKLQKRLCNVSINLLCHSMGNYLLKYSIIPTDGLLRKPIFDNVCLVAADTNNKDHKFWIENIETKSNTYIVINENDYALKFSRIKPGKEQLARLGHYTKQLNANNATYIDVTNVAEVNSEHSYFIKASKENDKLKGIFNKMFNGNCVTDDLEYKSSNNTYILKK